MAAKQAFRGAAVKLGVDKSELKQEFAYGHLTTDSLSQLYRGVRKITWSLIGLGTVTSVIEQCKLGQIESMGDDCPLMVSDEDLAAAMGILSLRCCKLNEICRAGIDHILCTLRLGKWAPQWWFSRIFLRRKKPAPVHVEDGQDLGTDAFLDRYDEGLKVFWTERTDGLTALCDEKEHRVRNVLFIVVFVEFLLFSVAQELRSIILFADYLRNTGEVSTWRIILPQPKSLLKGIKSCLSGWNNPGFGPVEADSPLQRCRYTGLKSWNFPNPNLTVLGGEESLHTPKIIRRVMRGFSTISHFLRGEYSMFGLRVALATFVAALPAYLASSAEFYVEYRGAWAIVTIILIMNPTAGASLGSVFFLTAGTLAGGLTAMAVWYMVDQKVAGVIVLSFPVFTVRMFPRKIQTDGRFILFDTGF